MFSARANGLSRKTAAQRSRDLFAAITIVDDETPEPAAARQRSLLKRGGPGRSLEAAAMPEAGEPMSASHLTVVPATPPAPETSVEAPSETAAQRIKRLQAEAQTLAREEVAGFERRIGELAAVARQISEGGDAYPVGAREVARRLAEDLPRQAGVLEALLRKL